MRGGSLRQHVVRGWEKMEEATNAQHHRHLYKVDRTADPWGGVTGGNQREIDRARAQKRKEKQGVKQSDKDGLTAAQRKER